jgi:hypothetical protein
MIRKQISNKQYKNWLTNGIFLLTKISKLFEGTLRFKLI